MVEDLSEQQIKAVLGNNFFGRLGLHDGDKSYVIPTNYVYDGNCILAHAVEGTKINIMRQWPAVCFQVEEVHTFTHWRSILAWGCYQELTEERDRYNAMRLFVKHQLHVKLPHASNEALASPAAAGKIRLEKPVIYRIVITRLTGKFEAV